MWPVAGSALAELAPGQLPDSPDRHQPTIFSHQGRPFVPSTAMGRLAARQPSEWREYPSRVPGPAAERFRATRPVSPLGPVPIQQAASWRLAEWLVARAAVQVWHLQWQARVRNWLLQERVCWRPLSVELLVWFQPKEWPEFQAEARVR